MRAQPLTPTDVQWVENCLLPTEQALWQRMSKADQAHAFGVAGRVRSELPGAPREVMAAALLHDVGKVTSSLGTFGRVAATLLAAMTTTGRHQAWAKQTDIRGDLGRYLTHPDQGFRLLTEAGSDPLTVAWAGEHHRPANQWTVETEYAAVLWKADDD
ncbi:MAG TPA: hypothetical protein EYQ49_01350 [Acidimicrobiia bacterium]|nr:hypothetical protein [Acidimicrobiia bacterium]